jgi:molecular chaperone IbpA
MNYKISEPEDWNDKDKWHKKPNPYPHTPKPYPGSKEWAPTPPPKVITVNDVFPRLDRWSIGFDNVFNTLTSLAQSAKAATYPPCNISKFGDDKWEIRMAVAGFKRNELEISVKDRVLTVKSDTSFKSGETREVTVGELIYQGIAERDFTHTFALSEYVEVEGAKLEDGILTIVLKQELPEEKKIRLISID